MRSATRDDKSNPTARPCSSTGRASRFYRQGWGFEFFRSMFASIKVYKKAHKPDPSTQEGDGS